MWGCGSGEGHFGYTREHVFAADVFPFERGADAAECNEDGSIKQTFGHCPGGGAPLTIQSAADCEAAARSLGLLDTNATTQSSAAIGGCYYVREMVGDEQLYFSAKPTPAEGQQELDTCRVSICRCIPVASTQLATSAGATSGSSSSIAAASIPTM